MPFSTKSAVLNNRSSCLFTAITAKPVNSTVRFGPLADYQNIGFSQNEWPLYPRKWTLT